MSTFLQDVAYGFRMLRRAPGFTAAAVLTLGIGIGINTATFSIVNILSLKPLAYRNPSRVAFILGTNAARHQRAMNLPLADAMDIGRQMRSLEGVAAYEYWSANLTGGSVPERIQAPRLPRSADVIDVAVRRGSAHRTADTSALGRASTRH